MAGLMVGIIMEGGNPLAMINIPAALIVFGGTLGVTIASVGLKSFMAVPKLFIKGFAGDVPDLAERRTLLVSFAEKARRDGLLALDDEASKVEDDFTRKGLQLVVDGTDPDVVDEVLGHEIDNMARRHKEGAHVFEAGGGYGPTMGVLGTVMGLVHVLENLSNPETLGHSIAGAFIATLYGVGIANVILLPMALRLKGMAAAEKELRTMTLEGILGIQAGDNPRIVADKLATFLPPSEREAADAAQAPAGGAGAPDLEMAA